ncbi:hypothetical protein JEP40_13780 [Proteus vulgaris]|uniref:hypothetical protein n=1 Tax=Proteus vulgaris TaxID=585 RepID=UPI0018E48556|nr:hypothetical protein [Proteus vulgaris]MBI6530178.1 hypothetical protein [Proteus vulgaris]
MTRILFILFILCFSNHAISANIKISKISFDKGTLLHSTKEVESIIAEINSYSIHTNLKDSITGYYNMDRTTPFTNITIDSEPYNNSEMLVITINQLTKGQCITLNQYYKHREENSYVTTELTPEINGSIYGKCRGNWIFYNNKIKIKIP